MASRTVQWPPDEANRVSEDTRNDLSRLQAIVAETEEACNLQQRPLNPVLEVREEPWYSAAVSRSPHEPLADAATRGAGEAAVRAAVLTA